MPFTLAHPAAVLPLHRRLGRWASLSSLVVGSLAPDFAYFLPLGIPGSFSHSLPGLFVFCLPVGLVVWGVYLAVLRPFFLALLPRAVSERLAACASRRLSLPIACGAAASVVAGAATHLVWDSFTHSTGFMVRALPALSTPVHLFDWYSPRVYTLLQHASTLGGLAALAVFGLRWYRSTEPRSTVRARPLSWVRCCCPALPPASGSSGTTSLTARGSSIFCRGTWAGRSSRAAPCSSPCLFSSRSCGVRGRRGSGAVCRNDRARWAGSAGSGAAR
jgi:hypothetical protein